MTKNEFKSLYILCRGKICLNKSDKDLLLSKYNSNQDLIFYLDDKGYARLITFEEIKKIYNKNEWEFNEENLLCESISTLCALDVEEDKIYNILNIKNY